MPKQDEPQAQRENRVNTMRREFDPGAMEQRVYGIEQSVSALGQSTATQINALSQQITNLATKIDERGKMPWPALSVMLSALVVIGGLVWYPVKNDLTRTESLLIKLSDTVSEKYVTKEQSATAGQRRDDWQRVAEERFKRVESDADRLQTSIVPRGEHEEKWRGNEGQIAALKGQIEDLKKTFGDTYGPRDALLQLLRRVEQLEAAKRSAS